MARRHTQYKPVQPRASAQDAASKNRCQGQTCQHPTSKNWGANGWHCLETSASADKSEQETWRRRADLRRSARRGVWAVADRLSALLELPRKRLQVARAGGGQARARPLGVLPRGGGGVFRRGPAGARHRRSVLPAACKRRGASTRCPPARASSHISGRRPVGRTPFSSASAPRRSECAPARAAQ